MKVSIDQSYGITIALNNHLFEKLSTIASKILIAEQMLKYMKVSYLLAETVS